MIQILLGGKRLFYQLIRSYTCTYKQGDFIPCSKPANLPLLSNSFLCRSIDNHWWTKTTYNKAYKIFWWTCTKPCWNLPAPNDHLDVLFLRRFGFDHLKIALYKEELSFTFTNVTQKGCRKAFSDQRFASPTTVVFSSDYLSLVNAFDFGARFERSNEIQRWQSRGSGWKLSHDTMRS